LPPVIASVQKKRRFLNKKNFNHARNAVSWANEISTMQETPFLGQMKFQPCKKRRFLGK
jgi:hypothetical protein